MSIMIRKRRKQSLTNYKKRVTMLKSGLPRLVVRKSNRSITMAIVRYDSNGDLILASAHSSMLRQYGWEPRANIPTAYLTGLLLAKRSAKLGLGDLILDIGLSRPIKGSIAFVAAKGAQDGGLKVRGNFEVDMKRVAGAHIAEYAKSLDGEKLKRQFGYKSIDPKSIEEAFSNAKSKIIGG